MPELFGPLAECVNSTTVFDTPVENYELLSPEAKERYLQYIESGRLREMDQQRRETLGQRREEC